MCRLCFFGFECAMMVFLAGRLGYQASELSPSPRRRASTFETQKAFAVSGLCPDAFSKSARILFPRRAVCNTIPGSGVADQHTLQIFRVLQIKTSG